MTKKHSGSCHCRAVTFEVEIDTSKGASQCNCSVCLKIGATSSMVKPAAFVLLTGEANLGEYAWGHRTGARYFCKTCGIHCFGRGHLEQVGGDYVSVNFNCLDDLDPHDLELTYWDGRHDNWQAGPRKAWWPVQPSPAS